MVVGRLGCVLYFSVVLRERRAWLGGFLLNRDRSGDRKGEIRGGWVVQPASRRNTCCTYILRRYLLTYLFTCSNCHLFRLPILIILLYLVPYILYPIPLLYLIPYPLSLIPDPSYHTLYLTPLHCKPRAL